MQRCNFSLWITVICVLVVNSAGRAEDWPQWRGPSRDCRVSGQTPWPGNLEGLQPTWRVTLAPSYSGPIVTDKLVFVTETQNKQHENVRALDRSSGKEIWTAKWAGAMKVPFFASRNGDWIRSTPAYDGESLFVAGMRDVLVCLDAKSGSERWRVDFTERYQSPLPSFGFVSSPLVDGDFIYTQAGASFLKLNKRTGKTLWRTLEAPGGMMDSAFSSPFMATLQGMRQVLVQTRQDLAGVDPETGQVLWSQKVPSFRGMNILTPTVYKEGILTSTHKKSTFFYQIDRNKSGYSVSRAWKNKGQGYMSSPVIIGDYAYLHLGNGRFSCLDLRTGQEAWRSQSFGQYCSMALNGNRILALSDRGELLLIDANPESFTLLDRRRISDQETWGHIAVAGNEIFVRELEAISAFRWHDAGNSH